MPLRAGFLLQERVHVVERKKGGLKNGRVDRVGVRGLLTDVLANGFKTAGLVHLFRLLKTGSEVISS
jgi:hypothetical protein